MTGDDAIGSFTRSLRRWQAVGHAAAGLWSLPSSKILKTASRIDLDDFYTLSACGGAEERITDLYRSARLNKLGPAFKNLAGPVKEFGF